MELRRLSRSSVPDVDLHPLGGTRHVHYVFNPTGEGLVVTDWQSGEIAMSAEMEGSWEGLRILNSDPRSRSFVTDRGLRMSKAGFAAAWRPGEGGSLLSSRTRASLHPGQGADTGRQPILAALNGAYAAVLHADGTGEIYRHADVMTFDDAPVVARFDTPGSVDAAGFVSADGRLVVVSSIDGEDGAFATAVLLYRPGSDEPAARRDIGDWFSTVAFSSGAGAVALGSVDAVVVMRLEEGDQLSPPHHIIGADDYSGGVSALSFVEAGGQTVLVRTQWAADPGPVLEFRRLDGEVIGTLQLEDQVSQLLDVGEDWQFAVRCGTTLHHYEVLDADLDVAAERESSPAPVMVSDWSASVEPWDLTAAETLELLCTKDPRPATTDTTRFLLFGEELMISAVVIRELVIRRVLARRLMPGHHTTGVTPGFFVIEEGKPLAVPTLAEGADFDAPLPPPLEVARAEWSKGDGRNGLKLGVYRADSFARALRSTEMIEAARQRLYERGYLADHSFKRMWMRLTDVKLTDTGKELQQRLRASTVDAEDFGRWVDDDPDRARRYLRMAGAAALTFLELEPHIRRLAGKSPGNVRQRPRGHARKSGAGKAVSSILGAADRAGHVDLGPAHLLDLTSTAIDDLTASSDLWTDLGNLGFHGGGHGAGHHGGGHHGGGHHSGHDGGFDGGFF